MLQRFADWFSAHPEAIVALIGALVTAAFKPRTPEEYEAMPPRIAAFLKVVGAIFPDLPKAVEAVSQIMTGKDKHP